MKQKLLLNWVWVWVWVWVRFRVRGFFSNCDAYQFFHVFHLVIHFFYCLQHRICFKRNMYFGPRVFRVLVFFLSISSWAQPYTTFLMRTKLISRFVSGKNGRLQCVFTIYILNVMLVFISELSTLNLTYLATGFGENS